jgi:hypothetical protein
MCKSIKITTNITPIFRKVAACCIGITLYGGGCVFIVLLAGFVQDIVKYAGYDGVRLSLIKFLF